LKNFSKTEILELPLKQCNEKIKHFGLEEVKMLDRGMYGLVILYKDKDGFLYTVKYRITEVSEEDVIENGNIYDEELITCICRNVLCMKDDCSQSIPNIFEIFICTLEGKQNEEKFTPLRQHLNVEKYEREQRRDAIILAAVSEYIPESFEDSLKLFVTTMCELSTLFKRKTIPSSKMYLFNMNMNPMRGQLYQILNTLNRLQKSVAFVHYDLKPDNIRLQNNLYDEECAKQYPKTIIDTIGYITVLIDFGLSRCVNPITGEVLSGDNIVRAFSDSYDTRFLASYIIRSVRCVFDNEMQFQPIKDFIELITAMLEPIGVQEILNLQRSEDIRYINSPQLEGKSPEELLNLSFFKKYISN
jgi:serine/threonine protein kinase